MITYATETSLCRNVEKPPTAKTSDLASANKTSSPPVTDKAPLHSISPLHIVGSISAALSCPVFSYPPPPREGGAWAHIPEQRSVIVPISIPRFPCKFSCLSTIHFYISYSFPYEPFNVLILWGGRKGWGGGGAPLIYHTPRESKG